jgi:hypothetical protein
MSDKKENLTVEEFLKLLNKISVKKKIRIPVSIADDLKWDRGAKLSIEVKSIDGKEGLFISKIE